MNGTETQDFRKEVLKRLIDLGKNTAWLSTQVTLRTGLYCDTSYLSRVLTGKRKGKNIKAAISEILGMEGA